MMPNRLKTILNAFGSDYQKEYLNMMRNKLGLKISKDEDAILIESLTELLQLIETDMTIFFRNLSSVQKEDSTEVALDKIKEAFYNEKDLNESILDKWHTWLDHYVDRINEESLTRC